jgi:hypothetical protein
MKSGFCACAITFQAQSTMLSQMNACVVKYEFEVPTWILLSQTNVCVAIFEFEVRNRIMPSQMNVYKAKS